jgi:hypothetical protein
VVLLLVIELLLVALIVAGVALIHIPTAMIFAGMMGLLICERGSAAQTVRDALASRRDRRAEKAAQ